MNNTRTDERAGKCDPADEPGCDRDPRKSTPLHRGLAGKKSISALFAANPNVIAYVSGHTHANRVDFFKGGKGRGFWEINTASHIDWPEQSRDDRGHGQQGRHAVAVRDAAGLGGARRRARRRAPARSAMTPAQLASLGRTLSFNDPQREGLEGSGGRREARPAADRNVELL